MQIRGSEAPRFERCLRPSDLHCGVLRVSGDSEPWIGLFGPSGELGQRTRGLDFGTRASFDQKAE
eukprot:15448127-Alexandrium_andersonii.AAC.1